MRGVMLMPLAAVIPYSSSFTAHKWLCPSCGSEFARTMSSRPTLIGPGTRTCTSCGAVFHDNSREWRELRPGQKLRYLFPLEVFLTLSICAASGMAVVSAFGFSAEATLGLVVALACLILGPFYVKWVAEIFRSKRRWRAAHRFDVEIKARGGRNS